MKTTNKNQNKIKNQLTILFAILLVLMLITNVNAQPLQEVPTSSINGVLAINITPTSIVCDNAPCVQNFNLTVTNNEQNNIQVALYERENDTFELISIIGNVTGGEEGQFIVPMSIDYNGLTTDIGDYAIISNDGLAKEFIITQNWQNYEENFKSSLSFGGYIIAPIIAIVIIVILFIVSRQAEKRKYGAPFEYTDESLFKISEEGTLGEEIASLLINPISWAIIFIFSLLLICTLAFSTYTGYSLLTKIQIIVISLVAASIVPIILMVLTWYADIVDREPFRFIVGMFMWGMLAAFIAFFINGALLYFFDQSVGGLPLALTAAIGSVVISPIVEESLKLVGLSFISLNHEFDDALDGLLYGFAIGIGFAMMENWFYFAAKVDPLTIGIGAWVAVILYRSLFDTIAHGCFTGLAGVLLGMLKSRDRFSQYYYIALIPGLFIAILLHMAFNFTAYLDVVGVFSYKLILVSFNPALVAAVAFATFLIYSAAVWDTKTKKKPKVSYRANIK